MSRFMKGDAKTRNSTFSQFKSVDSHGTLRCESLTERSSKQYIILRYKRDFFAWADTVSFVVWSGKYRFIDIGKILKYWSFILFNTSYS